MKVGVGVTVGVEVEVGVGVKVKVGIVVSVGRTVFLGTEVSVGSIDRILLASLHAQKRKERINAMTKRGFAFFMCAFMPPESLFAQI